MKYCYLVPYWNNSHPTRYWRTMASSKEQAENNVRWKLKGGNVYHRLKWSIGNAFIPTPDNDPTRK